MATNKRAGNHAAQQNDFLTPGIPTITSVTNVGTNRDYGNGAIVVNFTPDPNGPAATSYNVWVFDPTAPNTGGSPLFSFNGSSSPITVTNLQAYSGYALRISAVNSAGESDRSNLFSGFTVTTKPQAIQTISLTSPSANVDRVTWTVPNDGGSPITSYDFTQSNGSGTINVAVANITNGAVVGTAGVSYDFGVTGGTTEFFAVYANNANGQSAAATTASVTTTFSFAPFGAFGFSPFGFSPFGFSPFGFSPFGFSPFRCIAENTEVATLINGKVVMVKAKNLSVGTIVFSPAWEEYSNDDDPYTSRVEYSKIANKKLETGTISKIVTKPVEQTIVINNNPEKHYSLTQPVLARKKNGLDAWEFTKDLELGDIIWEYSFDRTAFEEIEITSLDIIDGNETVYAISIDNIHTFVAGGVILHNKL